MVVNYPHQLGLTTADFRPEPFKFINFPAVSDIGLKLATSSPDVKTAASLAKNQVLASKKYDLEGATQITLSSTVPVKGIVLDVEGDEDVRWSDQAIDLIPGDNQVVLAWGLNGRTPEARYLGDGSV